MKLRRAGGGGQRPCRIRSTTSAPLLKWWLEGISIPLSADVELLAFRAGGGQVGVRWKGWPLKGWNRSTALQSRGVVKNT